MRIDDFDFKQDRDYYVRISPSCPTGTFAIKGGNVIRKIHNWTLVSGTYARLLADFQSNGRTAETNRRQGSYGHREMFDIARTPEEIALIEDAYRQRAGIGQPGTAQRPYRMKLLPRVGDELDRSAAHIAETERAVVLDEPGDPLAESAAFFDKEKAAAGESKLTPPKKGGAPPAPPKKGADKTDKGASQDA